MAMIRPETEMKDTGIEWIGNIPSSWVCCKQKYVISLINGRAFKDTEFEEDGKYRILRVGNLFSNPKWYSSNLELEDDKYCDNGDLLYAWSMSYGPYIWNGEKVIYHYHIWKAKLLNNLSKRFAYYYLIALSDSIKSDVHETTMSFITMKSMNNSYIAFPEDIFEQQAIADYLDETCSKIDEIIAEAKASIDEYTTLKQALIVEITTSGLNKNIDFCETDFAWMGKIPTHWELKPFKYVLNERNEKNNPIKSTERLSLSIDKGITLYAEKTTNLDRFKDDFTAYKLAYKGDLVMNSMNMIVGASGVSDYFGCVSPVYYTYFDNEPDHITAKYCEYLFRSRMLMRVLRSLGRGIYHIDRGDDRVNTCRLKVSRDDLRALILPVPPLCEQRDIVSFLDKRIAEIDSLIAEKESLINDLEAYKKSLIYEVVTGKRRVV